ncbi:MAG: hypothetical protein KAT39_11300 [Alphaproteobacteria bacterium]|nr:hypothetical protein [Alphaproteobacteria bacterium]
MLWRICDESDDEERTARQAGRKTFVMPSPRPRQTGFKDPRGRAATVGKLKVAGTPT